jgi:hypothetical protein
MTTTGGVRTKFLTRGLSTEAVSLSPYPEREREIERLNPFQPPGTQKLEVSEHLTVLPTAVLYCSTCCPFLCS